MSAVYIGYADFEPESKAVPEGPGRGFGNHLGWMSMEDGLAAAKEQVLAPLICRALRRVRRPIDF